MTEGNLKRTFLYALIGSVGLSALLGMGTVLFGNFGREEIRILLTTLTISAASLCGLSCGAVIESRENKAWPYAGMVLAGVAAFLILLGIWITPDDETFWKLTATASIAAVACSHISLLLLAKLSPEYQWSRYAANATVGAVALILCSMIWFASDDEPWFRLLGVAAIADAAMTVLVPVFHRLSRRDGTGIDEIDEELEQLRTRIAELELRRAQLVAGQTQNGTSDKSSTSRLPTASGIGRSS